MKGLLSGAVVALLLTAGIARGEPTDQGTAVVDQDGNVSISNGNQSVVLEDGRITITRGDQTLSIGPGALTPTACATPLPTPASGSSSSVTVSSNGNWSNGRLLGNHISR